MTDEIGKISLNLAEITQTLRVLSAHNIKKLVKERADNIYLVGTNPLTQCIASLSS